ncbi:MAG: hypothetical protein RR705_11455, partial [Lachnospiraceae bacterium]
MRGKIETIDFALVVIDVIYKCTNKICNFIFSRAGEVDCCPDCGSPKIRAATADEQKEFEALLENKKET